VNLSKIVNGRHATKAFDASRKIPAASFAELETLLHLAPSSINSQPWHFVIADSDEGKARIAKSTYGNTAYNEPKIRNASHVVVFCARQSFDDDHINTILEQEQKAGRFSSPESFDTQKKARSYYANLHRFDRKDTQHWMEKQVYLALGGLLLGAAALEIDTCAIEGFDAAMLDGELDLRARGLTSVVIVTLGYSSDADFNARLPKSRLPVERVISHL
jgi:nitroreductase / dihydropteridine reductase